MFKNLLKNRNFRYGVVSVAITALIILFVVLLNAALTALFNKFPLSVDLTEDRIFEISGETKDFLASLEKDVTIYVLNTEDRFVSSNPAEYYVQANEVINKYAQMSPRVKITYLDLLRNPDFNSRYPDIALKVNDILLVSGNKHRLVSSSDLFNIRSSYYGSYVSSSKAEQTMTSALLTITKDTNTVVSIIGGHGEDEAEDLAELLRLNAYEVRNQNLFTENIPDDVSMLIFASPTRDLEISETRKLDDYLAGGNNRVLFYLASPVQPPLPNLDAFLGEWGIAVESGVVFETNSALVIGNSPFFAFGAYAEETYSQNASRQRIFPVIPQSRPLRMLFEGRMYRKAGALVESSDTSGIVPGDAGENWQPGPGDISGKTPLVALTTESRNSSGGGMMNNHVLVCGSVLAMNGNLLGSPNIANSVYFLDLLGNLTGREDRIFIMDKTVGFTELGITAGKAILLALIFVVFLPLAVFGAGIAVWLRRRHK
jgi:hypothetical protein